MWDELTCWCLLSQRAEVTPSPSRAQRPTFHIHIRKFSLHLSQNYLALVKVLPQSLLKRELNFARHRWLGNRLTPVPCTDSLRTLDPALLHCSRFLTKKEAAKEEALLHVQHIPGFQSALKFGFCVCSFSCFLLCTCFAESRSTSAPGFLCRCDEKK